jgi:hypothetical protein
VIAIGVAALLLAIEGPSLAPDPDPGSGAGAPQSPAPAQSPVDVPSPPMIPAAVAAGVLGLAAHAGARRRDDAEPAPGDGLALAGEPLVVFVGGHGTEGAPEFGTLIDLMDLDPSQARFFDYRWIVEGADSIGASQTASIDATADALNAYLAGLGGEGRPIYLIGFSKGGAGIAELLARWDVGSPVRVAEVRGAVLLDPPLASGLHGWVQSLGRLWGPVPDDGGYDPIACDPRCRDRRAHLGRAAGVEVLVIRNPKAGITSFDDHPEGLRVVDFPDDGPGPLAAFLSNPLRYPSRLSEAHNAVLTDSRVAGCIASEIAIPGSCELPPQPVLQGMGKAGFKASSRWWER